MATATIEKTQAKNANGYLQDCVIATCDDSGDSTPKEYVSENESPIWGHTYKSVRRALIVLSEECSCGARYHKASDGEDQEDADD